MAQAAREHRDGAAEKLRQKYAPKLVQLNERLRRAEAARQREADQAHQARFGTLVSLGSTLLGAFLIDPATEPLETLELSPAKSNINVRFLALVWLPHSRDARGIVTPAY